MYNNLIDIVFMLLCLLLSGYFSATETAFLSANKTRLRTLAEKGNKRAKTVLNLQENYDRLITTILIGNNLVNILLASLGTLFFIRLTGDIGATVSTVTITLLVLIFGELTPKYIAREIPERFAMLSAPLLRVLILLFTPLNALFTGLKNNLSKWIRFSSSGKMSQEELLTFVDEKQEEGSIDSSEGNLLKNVIEFSDRRAEDILTHRVDVEAVSVTAGKAEIARKFSVTKFSRLPVYEENIDHIIGILHQKDFYNEKGITSKPIRSLLTQPLFVTMDADVHTLMRALQGSQSHVAVVLDEYGGTYGIVTLEDILEELVGEIYDEHDDVIQQFVSVSPQETMVDCMVSLEDFCEYFQVEIESESVLLSGWILEQLGKIPEIGDGFLYRNLLITVTDMDAHRVAKVRVVQDKETGEKETT